MQFLIGNPWGWLGLFGLPVVVLLFMLQQKSRVLRTSTLFLLEHLVPESKGGRRLQRLVQSVPLWLMLLAVTVLVWLLLDPRRVDVRSRQTVVVLLDSSFSMQAFQEDWEGRMKGPLERLHQTAGRTRWVLMESDLGKPLLYRGEELSGIWTALRVWKPENGTHDMEPALRAARSLAGTEGLVIFVSDHKPEVPEGTGWIAVGRAMNNVGFAGAVVRGDLSPEASTGAVWEAVVRNYADDPVQTTWKLEGVGGTGEAQVLHLAAGEGVLLKGVFPPGMREATLRLESDGFDLDNHLPLLVPEKKVLQVSLVRSAETGPETAAFLRALPRALPGFREAREGSVPDVTVLAGQLRDLRGYGKNAVVLYRGSGQGRSASLPVTERHELTRDLSWNGLLADPLEGVLPDEGDEVLLWKDGRPLVVLRPVETAGGPVSQLHLFFDFEKSNAGRLPATAVLLFRFCERVRAVSVGFSSANVVLGQELAIARDPKAVLEWAGGKAAAEGLLRAPRVPSFFELKQGGRPLFRGAAQFSEALEADFRAAGAGDGTGQLLAKQGRANSEKDFWMPVWVLLLGGFLLLAWWWDAAPSVRPEGEVRERG